MLHIDAAQVAERLDRRTLIDALDAAFRRPHEVPARHHHRVGQSGTLLVMPAWDTRSLGVKIVTVFPYNALRGLSAVCASYLLLDALTGEPRALLDGGELTLRRTAAASALASRYLASPDAARLLMVGTGRLAPHLIESHALVRPLSAVRIWGRRADAARKLAASLAVSFADRGIAVEAAEDLEGSVRWARIVSCATLSHDALVQGAWLAPGQHLDLVGAFTREMREADDAALARCALYVDTRAGALADAGEIIGAIERGIIDAAAIRAEFADLAKGAFARRHRDEITVFKSVGTALEDLVAATLVLP
jgi:ornithine cyclodeaminase